MINKKMLNSKLIVKDDFVVVEKSYLFEKFRRSLICIPLFFIIFSIWFLSTNFPSNPNFKWMVFCLIFSVASALYFKFGYLEMHKGQYLLVIENNIIKYEISPNNFIMFPLDKLISVEDKSYFDDDDFGGASRGWYHGIEVIFENYDEIMNLNNLNNSIFLRKEKDNSVKVMIDGLLLSHDEHLQMVDYLKKSIKK